MSVIGKALSRLSEESFCLNIMLLVIQFPIADIRPFISDETGKLNHPLWPIPENDQDFMRSMGTIRPRWRGGLTGWVGENNICKADNAIRFCGLPPYIDNNSQKHIPFRVAYKRFYYDGLTVAKFEIGIYTPNLWKYVVNGEFSSNQVKELISHFVNLKVRIPNPLGEITKTSLLTAGKYLAKLYLSSSTSTEYTKSNETKDWWVQSCKPILLIEQRRYLESEISFPLWGKNIPLSKEIYLSLFSHILNINGLNLRIWRIRQDRIHHRSEYKSSMEYQIKAQENEKLSDKKSRDLRIYLLRLHAERECIRKVLKNIADKHINIEAKSELSERLQFYLNVATRRISKLTLKIDQAETTEVEEIAREADETIFAGERDAILNTLASLDIRKNIFHKVKHFVNQIIIQENIMGDKYIVGQAGAVGPHSHGHDINFKQIWLNSQEKIELSTLALELSRLREEMKKEAKEPAHDVAVGAIASAETAAQEGNGAKVLEYLAKSGQWALDVATKIGTGLAIQALKTALGL